MKMNPRETISASSALKINAVWHVSPVAIWLRVCHVGIRCVHVLSAVRRLKPSFESTSEKLFDSLLYQTIYSRIFGKLILFLL